MLVEISDVSVKSTDPGLVGCWGSYVGSGIGEGKKKKAVRVILLFGGGRGGRKGSYLLGSGM